MDHEVFDALEAEYEAFDATLGGLNEDGWSHPTLCEGWDVRDLVCHLWLQAEVACRSIDGDRDIFPALADLDDVIDESVRAKRDLSGPQVWELWHDQREGLVDRLRQLPPGARVQWTVTDMGAPTLGTTILMETWTHRYDVHAPLGADMGVTPGLRHVAWFVLYTLPFAFHLAGEDFAPVRFELDGPDGTTWTIGPHDTDEVVRGSAMELCLRGVNRLDLDDADTLRAEGDTAMTALRVMKTYP